MGRDRRAVHSHERKPHERNTTDLSVSYRLNEMHSRIEKEEKTRSLLEQRIVKSIDAAIVPIQSAIQDEVHLRHTEVTNIQSTLRALRSDIESDIPTRWKQMDGLKRQVAQTKDDVDKEVEERTLSIEHLTDSLQDLKNTVEHLKQEHYSSTEMLRKLVLEEERTRTSRLSMLQDRCDTMKNDTEAELKIIRQAIDARVRQRREGDDELLSRMEEYSLSIGQEQNNCEALKKELAEVKQIHKSEIVDMTNFMQVELQASDTQMNKRFACVEASLTEEISESKSVCEGVEKQLSVLSEEMVQMKDSTSFKSDEIALRTSMERAQQAIDKEMCDLKTSEEALRQQVEHLSSLVEPCHVVPVSTPIPDCDSIKQEEQRKPDWADSDLMRQVRSISMNHLEGNMRIWGGGSDHLSTSLPSMPWSLQFQPSSTHWKQPENNFSSTLTSESRASSVDKMLRHNYAPQ